MTLNKISALSLALLSSCSYAVVNGTSVEWEQQNSTVRLDSESLGKQGQCTGTLIAGKYVLTAAHCYKAADSVDTATVASGDTYIADYDAFITHPNYDGSQDMAPYDVGIISLDQYIEYSDIKYISNLTKSELISGQDIFVTGFGGMANNESPLNQAQFTFSESHWAIPEIIYIDQANDSHTTGGDSGSAWANAQGEIVGIHKGSNSYTDGSRTTYGTDLRYASDFILENIDGWHYPTLATVNGQTTITVQSLHQNGTVDSAYTEGDVTILVDESSCIYNGLISPFEKCTYVIESSGDEGKLFLSESEFVLVNKPQENDVTDNGNGSANKGSSGGSGGSMNLWVLLSMLGLAFVRYNKTR